jgi:hypothetical protein
MKILSLFSLFCLLASCSPTVEDNPGNRETPGEDPIFRVETPGLYDSLFLSGLKASGGAQRYRLKDSFLILNETDTVLFSSVIPLGKVKFYAQKRGKEEITVRVERVNYSTIMYVYSRYSGDSLLAGEKGFASVHPAFYLGGESDEDPETGEMFPVDVFYEEEGEKACAATLRIGGQGLKLSLICKDGKTEELPFLQEKK